MTKSLGEYHIPPNHYSEIFLVLIRIPPELDSNMQVAYSSYGKVSYLVYQIWIHFPLPSMKCFFKNLLESKQAEK